MPAKIDTATDNIAEDVKRLKEAVTPRAVGRRLPKCKPKATDLRPRSKGPESSTNDAIPTR